jgi:hypothetical protein
VPLFSDVEGVLMDLKCSRLGCDAVGRASQIMASHSQLIGGVGSGLARLDVDMDQKQPLEAVEIQELWEKRLRRSPLLGKPEGIWSF